MSEDIAHPTNNRRNTNYSPGGKKSNDRLDFFGRALTGTPENSRWEVGEGSRLSHIFPRHS